MKKCLYLLLSVLCLGLIVSCKTSQQGTKSGTPELADALLWEITGPEAKKSYLFGTIHLIDKEDYFFPDYMQNAFVETEALALEFNLDGAMDMSNVMSIFEKALMRGDTSLKDLVSEEEYSTVQKHFEEMGIPFFMLQRIKPMFLTIFGSGDMFSGDGFNMDDIKSYEMELTAKAKSNSMSLHGLETMEYQLSIFDRIPYSDQADMLIESIQAGDEQSAELDSLIHYYKQQDLNMLDALINSSGPTVKYKDILLDQRNRNWVPVIDSLMREQSTFFAVGAGHLPGHQGVINLLRKEGYQLKPIRPNGTD